VHTFHAIVLLLAAAHTCEYVHFVAFALQRSGEFGDVRGDASDGNRMQRLPT
jgi:hypothetical protein